MSSDTRRPPKQKNPNPITFAIQTWLATLPPDLIVGAAGQPHSRQAEGEEAKPPQEQLLNFAPKRWVAYDPMVLLPSGSFSSDLWRTLLRSAGAPLVSSLWNGILHEISKTSKEPLTHLAVNEGIPLKVSEQAAAEEMDVNDAGSGRENILRSPSGLRILHGNFGPDTSDASSEADFGAAFWVSTKQNGIHQVWAPRWTMFSRGNVKEKARLLDFHSPPSAAGVVASTPPEASTRGELGPRLRYKSSLEGKHAVDLYAGIGYFVFSYARMGLRVLCWELNPWSVEGLRRGAVMNRWSVKVVQGRDLERPTAELIDGHTQIVVFLEDNREAERRTEELRRSGRDLGVLHVNCGFLPSSISSWRPAWAIQGSGGDGWLHLHENVGVADIDARRKEIQEMFDGWAQDAQEGRTALAEHVELVKTFAPDVWHCVFDVYVTTASSGGSGSSIT